jgi:hypothetical protein
MSIVGMSIAGLKPRCADCRVDGPSAAKADVVSIALAVRLEAAPFQSLSLAEFFAAVSPDENAFNFFSPLLRLN